MSNPFNSLDEDEKAQESRYRELVRGQWYWGNKADNALSQGKWQQSVIYRNRARFYWQLRIADVLY